MDGKLIHHDLGNKNWKIEISNMIDESIEFPDLPKDLESITIDFGNVSYITSIGMMRWIRWLGSINKPENQLQIYLERLSFSFIRVVESVLDVLPTNAVVNSFYACFYCASCNADGRILIPNSRSVTEPNLKCESCGEPMEPELLFTAYEQLIKQAPKS